MRDRKNVNIIDNSMTSDDGGSQLQRFPSFSWENIPKKLKHYGNDCNDNDNVDNYL